MGYIKLNNNLLKQILLRLWLARPIILREKKITEIQKSHIDVKKKTILING